MVKELTKTNLLLAEHSRSIITLANKFDGLSSEINKYAKRNDSRSGNHETRITRLETRSSAVSGPKAAYKVKRKRK